MEGRTGVLPWWFRRHVVCWYSPVRQRCSNDGLAASPVLVDLGGRGLDLQLNGFEWSGASGVQSDGSLGFSGSGEYGVTSEFALSDFTVIANRSIDASAQVYCLCAKTSGAQDLVFVMDLKSHPETNPEYASFGYVNFDGTEPRGRRVNWMTPEVLFARRITRGSVVDSGSAGSCLRIGRIRDFDGITRRFFKGNLYDFFLFDTALSASQIQWVIDNLIDD